MKSHMFRAGLRGHASAALWLVSRSGLFTAMSDRWRSSTGSRDVRSASSSASAVFFTTITAVSRPIRTPGARTHAGRRGDALHLRRSRHHPCRPCRNHRARRVRACRRDACDCACRAYRGCRASGRITRLGSRRGICPASCSDLSMREGGGRPTLFFFFFAAHSKGGGYMKSLEGCNSSSHDDRRFDPIAVTGSSSSFQREHGIQQHDLVGTALGALGTSSAGVLAAPKTQARGSDGATVRAPRHVPRAPIWCGLVSRPRRTNCEIRASSSFLGARSSAFPLCRRRLAFGRQWRSQAACTTSDVVVGPKTASRGSASGLALTKGHKVSSDESCESAQLLVAQRGTQAPSPTRIYSARRTLLWRDVQSRSSPTHDEARSRESIGELVFAYGDAFLLGLLA